MVTLTNSFGVEPDKDSVVMNVSEGTPNDAKSAQGQPKAILICRRNSHPFQARTLILNTPAKIGRSVARARPSANNGIFDCKVLSRNHAIIWYEHDTGKVKCRTGSEFMIQDTKSSNGTFVNNQRLSKGGETSLPREFFSRDVVQFGVDVVENQRKGNEDSENSDENNHIVTHGCIVATVRLFHPNGKESKSGQPHSPPSPMTVIPHEKICKLELIVHEAQQREERLHDKLEELQLIIAKLEGACQEALTNRFEETRLLSKIESLEKQTKVMNKMMSGSGKCSEKVEAEIQQLLSDVEKVQSVAREIQERQHRKLLESEQKLVEAQRVASNLELEVIALREQASLTDSHLQDMGAKCRDYYQKIETLKSNFYAQLELTQKLEAQVAKFIEREVELEIEREFNYPNLLEPKFILEEKSAIKKDKENQELIEWCKNYEEMDKIEENDFINEDDKAEWLTKKLENVSVAMCSGLEHISNCIGQLVNSLVDVEKSRRNLEKLCIKKHELALQLDAAKMPVEETEKTEDELDGEKNEIMRSTIFTLSNEKITELENELKEQEEFLSQERQRLKDSETKATKLKCELEATIKYCKKLNLNTSNLKALLRSHFKSLEDNAGEYRQKIVKLEAEVEELENGHQLKLVEILRTNAKNVETEVRETQTLSPSSASVSTNTDTIVPVSSLELNSCQLSNSGIDLVDSKTIVTNLDKSSSIERLEESKSEESFESGEKSPLEKINSEVGGTSNDLGVWEKMQKVQGLLSQQPSNESPLSQSEFLEMKNLMSLIAEDLVHLLLREQQMSKDKQTLQEKLDKSKSNISSGFGLANQFVTLLLAVFLYYLGLAALQFFGIL